MVIRYPPRSTCGLVGYLAIVTSKRRDVGRLRLTIIPALRLQRAKKGFLVGVALQTFQ